MWTAAIKTAEPKNSEVANKSHHKSDKRLFPLKIFHACGSPQRTNAHLPHFSSRWHLLAAWPCPSLISFKEMSICHFFISYSPQGRWVFLNRREFVCAIFLPAKQWKKKPDKPPPRHTHTHRYVQPYWGVKALCSPLFSSYSDTYRDTVVAKMSYFRGYRCFFLLLIYFYSGTTKNDDLIQKSTPSS